MILKFIYIDTRTGSYYPKFPTYKRAICSQSESRRATIMAYPYPPQPQPSASAPNLVVPRVVIGPQYCAPYTVDLAVVKKVKTIPDGRFVVTDINNNIIFKILKGSVLSLHDRRFLVDAAGHPIVTLRGKVPLSPIQNIKKKLKNIAHPIADEYHISYMYSLKLSLVFQVQLNLYYRCWWLLYMHQ